MAGAGAPLRSLMEWMGHADLATTLRYADYSPGQAQGGACAEAAFGLKEDNGPVTVQEKKKAWRVP